MPSVSIGTNEGHVTVDDPNSKLSDVQETARSLWNDKIRNRAF